MAVSIIVVSGYAIWSIVQSDKPAVGAPRIPFVNGDFMLNDMEEFTPPDIANGEVEATTTEEPEQTGGNETEGSNTEVVVENLTIPWEIAFLPNGHLLITERIGNVVDIDPETGKNIVIPIKGVSHDGEAGLLGLALHPDFKTNHFVYLYRTSTEAGKLFNAVLRYTYENGKFTNETAIVEGIPGALFHDGGRIAFGPDGLLYITTGDAQNPEFAQDLGSLAGKILRVTDTGGVPPGNPFDSMVYSYGHRNPQGITWDDDGALWSTEHGRSGLQSGLDELNLIIQGGNYGWPESQGDTVFTDTQGPIIHSGDATWAPAGVVYYNGSIFFGGLRGEALYEAVLNGVEVTELKEHFKGKFGRIRAVVLGPDNMLYFTTSNRDGRGDIHLGDDKVIRVDPNTL